MLVYPFDPQCRLESNWIPKETLSAFPSKATRTLVPRHAPFFQKDCVVRKGDRELIEGTDFYFSIEHKVASHATAYRIYGGITIIRDELIPPFTIEYHPQGGTFEATDAQIKTYLDTKPDVWESDWGVLINSQYYPPVKILYDPEEFVSEPAIIEACHAIRDVITAKDESVEVRYKLYAKRIEKLRQDIERLGIAEHTTLTGNVHDTKPFHVGVLARNETAVNAKRIQGKDLDAFKSYILTFMDSLEEQLENKFKNGEDMLLESKFLLDGGILKLGESTTLSMDDEGLTHIGDNALTLVADKECTRPGTKASVVGGGNELTVRSSGSAVDDRALQVNEEEIVTESSLAAYVNAELSAGKLTVSTKSDAVIQFVGAGNIESPMECIIQTPSATEDSIGKVKIVNEGSHGYPCPGYSGPNFYIIHKTGKEYLALRNGADDLENDVFISNVTVEPFKHTPTPERFRPAGLPPTAKPTYVRHGTEDVVWLDTTDGSFVLLTNRSADYNAWRCLKVSNADVNPGYYAAPFIAGGKLYLVVSVLNPSASYVQMWDAVIPSTGNTITLSPRVLTGTNNNNTAQNSTYFALFDKMSGNKGDQKCYYYNDDGFFDYLSISHAGDQIDYVQVGTQVRFCHNGFHYMRNNAENTSARLCCSYVIDLSTGRLVQDAPGNYPIRMSRNGLHVTSPRGPLCTRSGNHSINGKRTNGKIFAFDTYGRLTSPRIQQVINSGGISEFENIKWNAQHYALEGWGDYLGVYGTVLHSGIRGATAYGKDRTITMCMDGSRVDFRYDPYGTYGPGVKGYGPTNDRNLISSVVHNDLKRIVWCNDGDGIVGRGTWLFKNQLSGYSTYADDTFGTPVSIDGAYYEKLTQQAVAKYATDFSGQIFESTLSLMVHRQPGCNQIGVLQVIHAVPGSAIGQRNSRVYAFIIYPDRQIGDIGNVTLGKLLYANMHTNTALYFVNDQRICNSGCFIHKLEDGGRVLIATGSYTAFIGDTQVPSVMMVHNAKGELVLTGHTSQNASVGNAHYATRELGFGVTRISDSGEGLYLDSYGKTTSEIVTNYNASKVTSFTLALSRSDAGDNVTISQLAATKLKDKITSLIPPSRKVQNMDLSQDRTITKAMIANSSNVPNVADINYPAQTSHTDSLSNKARTNHTHVSSDFTMAQCTITEIGAGKLGGLDHMPGDSVSVTCLGEMTSLVQVLNNRTKRLEKLDSSLVIDYEV